MALRFGVTTALCHGLLQRQAAASTYRIVENAKFSNLKRNFAALPVLCANEMFCTRPKWVNGRNWTSHAHSGSAASNEKEPTRTVDSDGNSGQIRSRTRLDQRRISEEFCLDQDDLDGLTFTVRHRTPFSTAQMPLKTYLKSDVEKRAMEKWGSREALDREKNRRLESTRSGVFWRNFKSVFNIVARRRKPDAKTLLLDSNMRVEKMRRSMNVVLCAAASNALVMIGKFTAFLFTGSASMLSEGIHSLADTANQTLLAIGIMRSLRQPDQIHPYGYLGERYVWALISGVGIFFLGCGVSCYHGIACLVHPTTVENLPVAFALLALSGGLEGASLAVAANQVRLNARQFGTSVTKYIKYGADPSDVSVLIEDSCAVLGVGIAAASLELTHIYGSPVFDAMGSVTIGSLLGVCALFLIHRNVDLLVGRSIPPAQIRKILTRLDQDPVISSTHDVKATQMGADAVRFKAEIDMDGYTVAQKYMQAVSAESILEEMRSAQTKADAEAFMIKHTAGVINVLGEEVDRIERNIKDVAPDVRHVDLEIL